MGVEEQVASNKDKGKRNKENQSQEKLKT